MKRILWVVVLWGGLMSMGCAHNGMSGCGEGKCGMHEKSHCGCPSDKKDGKCPMRKDEAKPEAKPESK